MGLICGYQKIPKYGLYLLENGSVKWHDTENTVFCPPAFFKCGINILIDEKREGRVGNGYAIVTNMRETLKKEEEYIAHGMSRMLCDNENCLTCRVSYSFSDSNAWHYFICQFLHLFHGEIRTSLHKLYEVFLYVCFSQRQT